MRIMLRDLSPGSMYYLQARVASETEVSTWSRRFTLSTTVDSMPPETPQGLTISMISGSILMQWDKVSLNEDGSDIDDLANYVVTVRSASSSEVFVKDTGTSNSFEFTLETNREVFGSPRSDIYFEVFAEDSVGNQSASATSSTLAIAPPPNVTGLVVTSAPGSVSADWDIVTSDLMVGYRVYMGEEPNFIATEPKYEGDSNSFVYTVPAYATDFYFRVHTYDLFGNESLTPAEAGPVSPERPFAIDSTPPATPGAPTAIINHDSMRVSWTAIEDENLRYYIVMYRPLGETDWLTTRVTYDETSATVPVNVGINYEVRLRADDMFGNVSGYSPIVETSTATVNTAPAMPTGLTLTPGADSISISWAANTEPDFKLYNLEVATNSAFTTGVLTYQTSANSISITGLPHDTQYWARINSEDTGGLQSAFTSAVTGTTTNYPDTPKTDGIAPTTSPTPAVTPGISYLHVSWTPIANNDIVTYEVHVGATAEFSPSASTKVAEITGSTVIVNVEDSAGTPLATGENYFVRTVAKDEDGTAPASASTGPVAIGITISDVEDNDTAIDDLNNTIIPDLEGKVNAAIKNYVNEYAVSDSETVAPTTGWSTATPTRTPGTFIWFRTVITYTDDTSQTTNPALLTGNTGPSGATGVGVSSITPYYQQTADTASAPAKPTTMTPTGWSATEPEYAANTALWRTDRILYTNSTFAYTDVTKVSSYAAAAVAQATADGKNTVIYSTTAATGTNFEENDLWFQRDASYRIVGQWVFESGEWRPVEIDGQVIASLDAGVINSGYINSDRIETNSLTINHVSTLQDTIDSAEQSAKDASVSKVFSASGGMVLYPPTAFNYTGYDLTGAVVIDTPILPNAAMTKVMISGYQYQGSETDISCAVGFYAYQSTQPILNTSFTNYGSVPVTARLAVKADTGSISIILNHGGTGWRYPTLAVSRVDMRGGSSTWADGWNIRYTEEDLTVAYTDFDTPVARVTSSLDDVSTAKQEAINSAASAASLEYSRAKELAETWGYPTGTEINGAYLRTGTVAANRIVVGGGTLDTEWDTKATNTYVDTAKADAIAESALVEDRALSRGTDLVTNGTGYLGNNYNWSTFTVNPDSPVGAKIAFDTPASGSSSRMLDEIIPVDPAKAYKVSYSVIQRTPGVVARHYSAIQPMDADGNVIGPTHYMYRNGTTTALTQPVQNGDTVLHVESTANWSTDAANHWRSIIVWNYVDGSGKKWPAHTYSRFFESDAYDPVNGLTSTTITLLRPWSDGNHPAGTLVSNGGSGGSYIYRVSNQIVTEEWQSFSGILGPGVHDPANGIGANPSSATTKLPPGTAGIRYGWLINRDASGGTSQMSFALASLSDASAAQESADIANTKADAVTTLTDSWTFTGTTEIDGGAIRTDTLDAAIIKAGSTFTQNLGVSGTFTLGNGGIIQTATGGVQLTDSGIIIPSGHLDANVLKGNTAFVNVLNVGAGGAIQSTGYTAGGTSGFQLSNTGLVIKGSGNVVDAGVIKGGTITGTTVNIGAGGVLNVDSTAVIKSNNYSSAAGYRLDSSGLTINSGSVNFKTLKTGTLIGETLTLSGSAARIEGTGFSLSGAGLTITDGSIDASALNIQVGQNLVPPPYADFEYHDDFYNNEIWTWVTPSAVPSASAARFGTKGLLATWDGTTTEAIFFGSGTTAYNILVDPIKPLIVSAYTVSDAAASDLRLYMRFETSSSYADAYTDMLSSGTSWSRVSGIITPPAGATGRATLAIYRYGTTTATWSYIDGIQIEEQVGNLTTPSTWMPPSQTSIDGGAIKANTITADQIAFKTITGEEIASNAISADQIEANAINGMTIQGVHLLASVLTLGESMELTEGFGLRQFGPNGDLNVSIPSDGSEVSIRGDVSARSLTSTGNMSVQGTAAIASGASLELESGVVPPVVAPNVSPYVQRTNFPPLSETEKAVGLTFADGHFWRAVDNLVGGGQDRIEKIATDGTLVSSFEHLFIVTNGITAIGNELFVLGRAEGSSGNNRRVRVYSLTGTLLRSWEYEQYGTGTYQPGIGTNGTDLIIGQCWADGLLTWRRFSASTGALLSQIDTSYKLSSDVVDISQGLFDYPDDWKTVITSGKSTGAVHLFTTAGAPLSNAGWFASGQEQPAYATVWANGRWHHMTQSGGLITMGTTIYPSGPTGGDADDWWASVTWGNGTNETTKGPSRRFVFMRRTDPRVSFGTPPAGATTAKIYLARGWTEPAATDFHLVGEVSASAGNLTVTLPANWTSGANPPTANSFPSSTPGVFQSGLGNFEVDGTGAGTWGPLTFHPDGTMSSSAVPAWVPITSFASGFGPETWGYVPAYRIWPDGKVEWRGVVAGSVTGTSLPFVVPAEARPSEPVNLPAIISYTGGSALVTRIEFSAVASPTQLRVYRGDANYSWFSLDGVTYYLS